MWSISLLGCKFCELVQTLIASWLAHSYKKRLSNLPIEKYYSSFFHNLYATTTWTYNSTFNPIITRCPLSQTWLKLHKNFPICPISLPCSSNSDESTRHDMQPQFFQFLFKWEYILECTINNENWSSILLGISCKEWN